MAGIQRRDGTVGVRVIVKVSWRSDVDRGDVVLQR